MGLFTKIQGGLNFAQNINADGGEGPGDKIDVGGHVSTSWIKKSMYVELLVDKIDVGGTFGQQNRCRWNFWSTKSM